MMRAASSLIVFAFLSGCASAHSVEGQDVFVGVIESVSKSDRQPEPPGAVFSFETGEMAVQDSAAARRTEVYGYRVTTPYGEVTAQVDEKFALGDCVEVSGKPVAGTARTFAYGETRMKRSSRCFLWGEARY